MFICCCVEYYELVGGRTAMLKQIEVHGHRFEFCSVDGGRTWSSDFRSLVAYKRRQTRARAEAQKAVERMHDEIPGLDPGDLDLLSLPNSLARSN